VLTNGSLGKRIPDYHWWDNRSTGPVTYSELPHVVASALLSYNTENAKPLITPGHYDRCREYQVALKTTRVLWAPP